MKGSVRSRLLTELEFSWFIQAEEEGIFSFRANSLKTAIVRRGGWESKGL